MTVNTRRFAGCLWGRQCAVVSDRCALSHPLWCRPRRAVASPSDACDRVMRVKRWKDTVDIMHIAR